MFGIQYFVRNVVYPLNLWFDGEWSEMQYSREYEKSQYLSSEEIEAMQLQRLRRLLDHAYRNCPYYREKWRSSGILPTDVRGLEDLATFPILTKEDIQRHHDEMLDETWPRNDMYPNQTGGSTGRPITFYQSRDRSLAGNAATWRHNRWAGYEVGDKVALVWGATRDIPRNTLKSRLRNLLLDRALYLDTGHITESKLHEFHKAIERFRPKTIVGYARSLTFLARFLKNQGLSAYQPHSIITSAEVLDPPGRALLEEVFGCPVFDRYGSREVGVLASECQEHAGLHICAEGLYLEVIAGGRLAAPGQLGKIFVTDLRNYAMPLIRYEIGDMAAIDTDVCPCGRHLPRLRNVAGRVTDFVVGSDGRLISGVFLATYVVAQRPSLGQIQIRQDTPGRLLYRIAPLNGRRVSQADLEFLTGSTKEYIGRDTQVDFEFVEELTPEPSGKYLFCRSTASSPLRDLTNKPSN